MGDALTHVAKIEQRDAALRRVLPDLLDQPAVMGIGDVLHRPAVAQHIVIGRGEAAIGPPQLQPARAQLRDACRRAVMHQVTVDVEQRVAVVAIDDHVALPDLLEHCPGGGHAGYSAAALTTWRKAVRRSSHSAAPNRAKVWPGEPVTGGCLPSRFTSARSWSQTAMM